MGELVDDEVFNTIAVHGIPAQAAAEIVQRLGDCDRIRVEVPRRDPKPLCIAPVHRRSRASPGSYCANARRRSRPNRRMTARSPSDFGGSAPISSVSRPRSQAGSACRAKRQIHRFSDTRLHLHSQPCEGMVSMPGR